MRPPLYFKNIFNTNIKTYTFIQSLHQNEYHNILQFFLMLISTYFQKLCKETFNVLEARIKYTVIKLYTNYTPIILFVILYFIDPY